MVKHIVFWKLKEEKKEQIQEIVANLRPRFEALVGVVDGLLAIELGKNYNGSNFDLVLYCEFTTKEAQDAYQQHPAHVAIKGSVHEVICDRASVDYER